MKIVKPITTTISVMDSLLIISGLTYLENDTERHEVDREGAKKLKDRILREMKEKGVEVDAI